MRRTSGFLCIVQLSVYKTIIRFLELRHDYRRNSALPLVGLVNIAPKVSFFLFLPQRTHSAAC